MGLDPTAEARSPFDAELGLGLGGGLAFRDWGSGGALRTPPLAAHVSVASTAAAKSEN